MKSREIRHVAGGGSMREDSPQWVDIGQPASPGEAEALRVVKELLTDGGIIHAWSNLSFISVNGRLAEVDVLLLTQNGLVLVELKGWHGRIAGNQQTWLVDGRSKPNPLFLTDQKAKWLRALLEYVQGNERRVPIPFIRAITVLHGKDSVVALDEVAAAHTYGLDGFNVSGIPSFSSFLSQKPTDSRDIVDLSRARKLHAVVTAAGFVSPSRVRMVGQYAVDRAEPIDQGAMWSDVIAEHPHLQGVRKRIRLYDVPRGVSPERRTQITRMAQREFLLTRGLTHPGVVAPEEFFDDPQAGSALVFDFEPAAQRLDGWLAANAGEAAIERRLAVLRQLGEIIQYAHARGVTHRALTPQHVYIQSDKANRLKVSVRDWQTGREDPGAERGTSTPSPTVLLGTRHVADLADAETWVYLAPEVHTADDPDGVALDVYGLGAIGYFLITEQPPAANLAELEQRLRGSQGLDPSLALDGIPDELRELVRRATHPDPRLDRTANASAFLAELDDAEKEMRTSPEPEPSIDPLTAQADELLDDRFYVQARLGSGSTGLALRVSEDLENFTVLKIAHDATKEIRLREEYAVLESLDSPRVVKVLEEPIRIGGHLMLHLEDAGLPTLGARIRDEGRLTLDQLERWGGDLLEAAAHLDAKGVLHRDIKPDNLGVRPAPGDRRPRLVLFDFSLSNEPLDHVKAGTPPYLDPFLGAGRRPRYDRAAERFAIAVTLFEMATGQRPTWGSGDADPASITDEVTIGLELFEPAVAEPMAAFFREALARDSTKRFGDLAEMAQAWAGLFAAADSLNQIDDDDQSISPPAQVIASTELSQSGMSARAQSVLARIDVTTVGELLATSPFKINNTPGMGEKTRREIQQRLRDWRRALSEPEPVLETALSEEINLGRGIDSVIQVFRPRNSGQNPAEIRFAELILGLVTTSTNMDAWPSLAGLSNEMEVTRPRVSQILDKLRPSWLTVATETGLYDEVTEILNANQGIAEVKEIAKALLAIRGSAATEPARTRESIGAVRAVLEADLSLGGDSRFTARRMGDRVVIAAEPQDPEAPAAESVLDWIRALADTADVLASRDSISVRAAALDALRTIPTKIHSAHLSDDRLLQIAAAASKNAAVGSRGEIYPRNLDASEAIRLTLLGTSLGRQGLTPDLLAAKVAGRFPEAQAIPPRPALDQLLTKVDAGLVWNGHNYGNATAGTTGSLLSTQQGLTIFGDRITAPPFDVIQARLKASLAANGYLTLAVDPRRQDQTAKVLISNYGVKAVNITALLIEAAKAFAVEKRVDWSVLIRADAEVPTTTDRAQLQLFISEALKSSLPAILESTSPLLLTDTAPLGRYHQENWLATLADLTTARPAARWVLAPHRASTGVPTLDRHVAVPLGSDGYLTITSEFLETHAANLATNTDQEHVS